MVKAATKTNLYSLKELKSAEEEIIRCIPNSYFGEEIALLRREQCLKSSGKIFKLDPFMVKNGIL